MEVGNDEGEFGDAR